LDSLPNLGFIGLKDEYESFLLQCPSAQWIKTNDFLEVGRVIMACKTFISNQTAAWALSQALCKKNCILEVCLECPNSFTFLPECYGVISQKCLEVVFKKINKEDNKQKQWLHLPHGI
jgi:hypothetical protein